MSILKVNAVTDASGGNTATINSMTPTADSLQGQRNRIINGDMRIDQRNAGASVTANDGTFSVDRWTFSMSQSSKATAQQNAGSVTPPAGFSNYLGITSSSAYTVGASEWFSLIQNIEGFNFADLGWGTANAKTVTLSFWVRSSLTGTFGGVLINSAANRTYPFTYSIASANTWTSVSVTIPGDTSGTWIGSTNGLGLRVWFNLGAGASASGTAGAWAGTIYRAPSSTVQVVATNGATFYITGVQLEVGSVATPFERRDYGRELIMCQRYYYLHAKGASKAIGSGGYTTSIGLYATVQFPVSMRTAPTSASATGTNYYTATFGSSNDSVDSFTVQFATEQSTLFYNNTEASGTANSYAVLYTNNASSLLAFQAEL